MKFITEEDLRDVYRREPFTTYEMEPGTRITPGARQFLADRGIHIFDDVPFVKQHTVNAASALSGDVKQEEAQEEQVSWRTKKLYGKMKTMEALFLSTGAELLNRDASLSQSVINLGKQFRSIRTFDEGKSLAEIVCCRECQGMNPRTFYKDMGDCFDITEFHIELEKGREILALHQLRCRLREVISVVMEAYEGDENKIKLCEEMIGQVNRMINALSQMICSAVGGKECQRKS